MQTQHDKTRRTRQLAAVLAAAVLSLEAFAAPAAERYEYFHTDALGSVVAVSDDAGQIIERREYEPFGSQLAPTLRDGPGYAGHVADEATGLLHMQQRYYDPAGIFVSVDPVTAQGGDFRHFNRYAYAYNNPYRYNDPDGQAPHIVVKAAGDFALELTFQYLTTGSVDFGQAAIETAKGVVNPMRTVQRAGAIARIVKSGANARRSNIAENAARGRIGEAATREKLGDRVAGEQVSFKTSDGTRTRADFVTRDGDIVETKTGNARLSAGQEKLQLDVNAGRQVTPVGQNATNAGLPSGQPTTMKSCTVDRVGGCK